MKKRVLALVLCVCTLFCIFVVPVSAQDGAPTDSFTRWGELSVPMRPVYEATTSIDATSLGLEDGFGTIRDMDCDEKGNIYVLTEDSRVVCINSEYELVKTYAIVDCDGMSVDFSYASGICVTAEGTFYIADTQNARVLFCENEVVKQEILVPESALIPSDFMFNPLKVELDSKGFLYVLCEGSYYGAVLFNPDGEFIQFFGANTTSGTILSTLGLLWDKLTMNDTKRAKQVKTLPYQFIDLTLDENDFVYTCTGMNSGSEVGQLRMLNPGGSNILASDAFNFGETDYVKIHNQRMRQDFISVQVDEKGFIYAFDKTYGLIYIYDSECNLLSAFGGGVGTGNQQGVFAVPCALALSDSVLYAADSERNTITVFERTEYGELLLSAQQATLKSDHTTAAPLWEQVQQLDSNSVLALSALAKAAYAEKNYSEALFYAKEAKDAGVYSLALGYVQKEFFSENYWWLLTLIVLAVGGFAALLIISNKRELALIKNPKVRVMSSAIIHPFASFGDIKNKGLGSLPLAIGVTVAFYITSVFAVICSDFRYTTFSSVSYNALFQVIQTIGLVLVWSLANWAVCTLMHGIGTLKEIFIVTAYSTIPMCLYNVISTPITHLLTTTDSTIITGLNTVALILTGVMLCVGLMIIHDYDFFRLLLTALITVFFIIIGIFFVFLVGILFSQFWDYIVSAFIELLYR